MEKFPSEIITRILKYLSVEDRRQMSLINKTWYYASLHPTLLREEVIAYYHFTTASVFTEFCGVPTIYHGPNDYNDNKVQDFEMFQQVLLDSKRTLFNLKFKCFCLNDGIIFEKLGHRIKSLNLRLDKFSDSNFDSITNYCENLQTLQLESILDILIIKPSRKPLLNLNSLHFKYCNLSDMSFNAIVQCAPNLTDVSIDCINVLEWPQAIRRFYPNYMNCEISQCFNSDAVFTSVNILNYLQNTKNINKLGLLHPLIFSNLPKHIKLKSLILNNNNASSRSDWFLLPPNNDTIQTFISKLNEQTSLERLELHNVPCYLLMTVMKLHNLKYLELHLKNNINNENVSFEDKCLQTFIDSLRNMKNIKTLIIGTMDNINGRVVEIPDCTLKSLTSLEWPLESSLNILQFGKHLTKLNIKKGYTLTASDLHLLFKNLTNLMDLSIYQCINLDDNVFLSLPISNIKGLISLKIIDANLTYRCLQNIKLSHLKVLNIANISLGSDTESENLSDFEHIFKSFGYSLPALITLNLQEKFSAVYSGTKVNTEYLRPYFSKVKNIVLIKSISVDNNNFE